MDVVCIKKPTIHLPYESNLPSPNVGDICEVVFTVKAFNSVYYLLNGYGEVKYRSDHFAVVSEIDETTFSRNYQKETA